MKVSRLIEMLQELKDPDAEIFAWDPEAEQDMPITGLLSEPGQVLIQTDEP